MLSGGDDAAEGQNAKAIVRNAKEAAFPGWTAGRAS